MANPQICSVSSCGNKVRTKGLCQKHYLRWIRRGDTAFIGNINHGMEWIYRHAHYTGNECLTWPFSRSKATGYGKAFFNKKDITASRAMCTIAHGEPPTPKHQAGHTCGKGHEGCVNPKHLRWILPFENCEDRVKHGTAKQLTQDDKNTIRVLSSLVTQKRLAQRYGVNQSQISRAITGARRAKYV